MERALTAGTHCPSCQQDIGIWAIMLAALPSRITCPHCTVALAYEPLPWKLIALFTALYFGSVFWIASLTTNLLMTIPAATLRLRQPAA